MKNIEKIQKDAALKAATLLVQCTENPKKYRDLEALSERYSKFSKKISPLANKAVSYYFQVSDLRKSISDALDPTHLTSEFGRQLRKLDDKEFLKFATRELSGGSDEHSLLLQALKVGIVKNEACKASVQLADYFEGIASNMERVAFKQLLKTQPQLFEP